jgi:hypothetical protein
MKELKNILIDGSPKTPQVDLNHFTGDLIFSGRSIPENATEFYDPIVKWIAEYVNSPRQTTNLRFNLEYFNTASSIWLSKIVKQLSRIDKAEYVLFIHLYFFIEEFDNMEIEDIKDALNHIVDSIASSTVSVGVKIYGTDENGKIIKESIVLL